MPAVTTTTGMDRRTAVDDAAVPRVDARQAEIEGGRPPWAPQRGQMALAAKTKLSGANAADTVSGLIDDAATAMDITDESTPAAVAGARAAIKAPTRSPSRVTAPATTVTVTVNGAAANADDDDHETVHAGERVRRWTWVAG